MHGQVKKEAYGGISEGEACRHRPFRVYRRVWLVTGVMQNGILARGGVASSMRLCRSVLEMSLITLLLIAPVMRQKRCTRKCSGSGGPAGLVKVDSAEVPDLQLGPTYMVGCRGRVETPLNSRGTRTGPRRRECGGVGTQLWVSISQSVETKRAKGIVAVGKTPWIPKSISGIRRAIKCRLVRVFEAIGG